DELRGPERRYADEAHEATVVEVVLRHRGAIAADEVGLVRFGPEQVARLPLVEQEVLDGAADARPQRVAVVLEHGPLRSPVDRVLQIDEVAPHVDVLPLGSGGDGARAPDGGCAA